MDIPCCAKATKERFLLNFCMSLRPAILILCLALWCFDSSAQTTKQFLVNPVPANPASPATEIPGTDPQPAESKSATAPATGKESTGNDDSETAEAPTSSQTQFRVERMPLVAGAELITIFARLDGLRVHGLSSPEVPLISVVRDTLTDSDPDNDRLRYVWMLTYTQPNVMKRIASAVPFLYQHVGNQTRTSKDPPKPILDLANISRQTWNRFFWTGMQHVFLDSYGIPIKASTRTYRHNASDYRSGHVMQALSILDNYERL